MAKDVGAKKVIVASCAPPIRLVTFVINFNFLHDLLATPVIPMSTESTCLRVRNWLATAAIQKKLQ